MPGSPAGSGSRDALRSARLSRMVALLLRHRPETVGLHLDAGGFVILDDLAHALTTQPGWSSTTTSDLIALAESDPRRFEVKDGRIRARYGHTVAVDAPGDPAVPPEWLYAGASVEDLAGIAGHGLQAAGRQRVHLSATPQAALEVGRRHAPDAVVVVIFSRRAAASGIAFRLARAGLYLTTAIPPEFLQFPADAARHGTGEGV